MPERRTEGSESLQTTSIVDDVFEKGDVPMLKSLKRHPNPAVRDRRSSSVLSIIKQHPLLALGLVIGAGITCYSLRKRRAHQESVRLSQEEFIAFLNDPLASELPDSDLNLKTVFQYGETAIVTGHATLFVNNLCTSSIQHPKQAEEFWGSLNPFHPIFNELLDPQSEKEEGDLQLPSTLPPSHPHHPKPKIHPNYDPIINDMIAQLKSNPIKINQERGEKIEKAIKGKLDRRSK